MNTTIVQSFDEKYKQDLLSLYRDAWWSCDRTAEDVDIILSKSSFYIGIVANDTNQLIAFSRVLTDYFQFSYIYDVIVHRTYRGYGVGRQLIETIINDSRMKAIKNIELVCPKDMVSFYNQFGFTADYGKSISLRLQQL